MFKTEMKAEVKRRHPGPFKRSEDCVDKAKEFVLCSESSMERHFWQL